ncbi:RidA family protein [Bacillus sp. ISL-35]|uniref:RidA family protein n=1 Tax=Bacillus sp. ISL-35 TaxID=2819122 RepID=UPI001BE74EA7|nr:RidA family protein [Bacillus sp. ISL-35]MBT2679307.1 RidA family protein [Bacillus sp. ISL-35]MBT2703205.1 RidA family protein [Chryseobacterium sp. ISL-80]
MEGVKKGIEERLKELNIQLPVLVDIKMPFQPGVISGNMVYLSGQTPRVNGVQKYSGTLGVDISIEEAQEAARICTLNLLAALKGTIGDLNKVKRVVKMDGYVAATSDFKDHPAVINVASNLLNEIFGKENGHARKAVGMVSLPGGAPVEIEMVVEIK